MASRARADVAVDKRRQILDAAVRVFARQGFHSTRVSDIADEAGVAYGLVYHYFRSKDQVLNELFSERWSLLLAAIEETDGDPVVFREFVSELLRTQDVEPPGRSMPGWLGHALAAAGEPAWKHLPLPGRPPLARFTYWVLTQECTIDDSKARRELGYAAIVTREEGLVELRNA